MVATMQQLAELSFFNHEVISASLVTVGGLAVDIFGVGLTCVPITTSTKSYCLKTSSTWNFQKGKLLPLNLVTWLAYLVEKVLVDMISF